MMKILLVMLFHFLCTCCFGQVKSVGGSVIDPLGQPLANITVTLLSSPDSFSAKTNQSGHYYFENKISNKFFIQISTIGYENYLRGYLLDTTFKGAVAADTAVLQNYIKVLQEVVLTPTHAVIMKGDTIEYTAAAFQVREGALVEDLLKKLPGINVDREGVVKAQGEEIQRIRINGKDYFDGDVKTATQNLPAGIVENIQIIKDYGNNAKHTGIIAEDGEKIININLKKDKKKGIFGNATIAGGTRGRYQASLSANNFDEGKQLSLLATVNNINVNAHDLYGGGTGSNKTHTTGGMPGINQLATLGSNYYAVWAKKIISYGSFSVISRKNSVTSSSFVQDFNPVNINTITYNSRGQSESHDKRIGWNFEYNLDSSNLLKITPYLSSSNFLNAHATNAEYKRPAYFTLNNGSGNALEKSLAGGTNLFYVHKFKKSSTLSLSATRNRINRNQDRSTTNDYFNLDSSTTPPLSYYREQNQFIKSGYANIASSFDIAFTEILGKDAMVEASYMQSNATSKSLRDVNDVDQLTGEKTTNTSQSNEYSYRFSTNRLQLSVSARKRKLNYYVALAGRPYLLTGSDERKNIHTRNSDFNLIPTARIGFRFSRNNFITASYNGTSREPGFLQLQPVSDSSNLKNIITGNPNLRPELTNRFSIQYNKISLSSGSSLFTNLSINKVQDRIVSSRVNDAQGTGRTTTFVNTGGFHGMQGSISLSQPFKERRFTISLNGSGSYDNDISYADYEKNTGSNCTVRSGINLLIDLPNRLDINAGADFTYNKNTTRYPTLGYHTDVKSWHYTVEGKYYFLRHWTLGYDFTKNIFKGYLKNFNTGPSTLNLLIERRILKNNAGLLRLQGFDLFNENTAITRSVYGTTITYAQTNRLSRYFIVSFNYRLQKFGLK